MPPSRAAFDDLVAALSTVEFEDFVAALLAVDSEAFETLETLESDAGPAGQTVVVRDGTRYRLVTGRADSTDSTGSVDETDESIQNRPAQSTSRSGDERLVYHPAIAPDDPPERVLDLYTFACYGLDREPVDAICEEQLGTRLSDLPSAGQSSHSDTTARPETATDQLGPEPPANTEQAEPAQSPRYSKRPDGLAASPEFLRYGSALGTDVPHGDENLTAAAESSAGETGGVGPVLARVGSTRRLAVLAIVVVSLLVVGGGIAFGLLPGMADDAGDGTGAAGSNTSIAAEDPDFRLGESDPYPGDFGDDTLTDPTPFDDRPPGLADHGITDAAMLAQAHANVLAGQSYRWTLEFGGVADPSVDGPEWQVARQVVTVENQTAYRSEMVGITVAGDTIEQTSVADGETRQVVTKKGDTYAVSRQPVAVRYGEGYHEDRAERFVELYLDSARNIRSASYTVGGTTYHRIVGWSTPPSLSNVSEYRFVAVVTEEGLVQDLSVRYVQSTPDGPRTVTVSFHYDEVGTAVRDPDAEATAEDSSVPAGTTETQNGTGTTDGPAKLAATAITR
ncbi:hypothetical protein [Haloarchaeobius sp. HME9146]|uniref:hypothetical protein n=1 Tax=Haloarchaeobius sp. HME9146 TaxID=2978732 RepID=UPI0021C10E90|nr:hypothetical protein [Haloarchaeobius sp. HME9146]MCT9097245.1 hypothetical protein [Haloarchaeobius sp. HME9146]